MNPLPTKGSASGAVSAPGAPRPVTPVALLADTLARLAGRSDLPPDVVAELSAAAELASGVDGYAGRCTTPESPALRELAARTAEHDWRGRGGGVALEQEMLSGHVEGQLLKTLLRALRARRVLEIGMFTGYSALAMAEELPDDGVVVACELDPDVAAFARERFSASPHGRKVDVRVGPALDTLAGLVGGEPFDLVFVDADKAGYTEYLAVVLDGGLLAPHGLVCVDNTLMQGKTYLPGARDAVGAAVDRFNRHVAQRPDVAQVLVPVRDGLTLIRRVTPGTGEP
ncbi:O-methyltransferase [Actinosynnema mirum]|uniref:O-methyltransferase family 3 n=1 Tax=Actinosynnema mirum (strain ATCC 29888 / DSM 43827 / JCM 3225 / NBRC 14064 / NCIMB 13271 / NRRL B-12336 / IMRU 3971 / 101) TaxID=446462 RepID=C6WIM3_ACTMD|nr:class I SAM-dependent methyltransferase [Actinosynnema mirum]ACU38113.1 O-methyltransferase family 3 [Actinosynnema mirum DSM 43827]